LKYETLKSVVILSNVRNVKYRCANVNPPVVKTFWRQFWFKSDNLSRDRLVATCVRFLAVWKSYKHTNPESSSCNHLGAFYLTCFARMCEIFTSVVSESQRGPHVMLSGLYAATHMCMVFVFFSTDKKNQRCNLWKRRPCVV